MDYVEWLNVGVPIIVVWLFRLERRLVRIETALSILSGLRLENDGSGCPDKGLNITETVSDTSRIGRFGHGILKKRPRPG